MPTIAHKVQNGVRIAMSNPTLRAMQLPMHEEKHLFTCSQQNHRPNSTRYHSHSRSGPSMGEVL